MSQIVNGWNAWVFFDGLLVLAVLVVIVIAAVDDWRASRERERAFAARMRRVLPERRR